VTPPPRWLRTRLLLRGACVIGLVALLSTTVGVLFPYALPVVFSMSVGQGLGVLAFVCYLLAIVAEVLHHEAVNRKLGARPSDPKGL
jgi:hypothetical protein